MMQHLTKFSGIRSLGKKAGFFTLSCLLAFSGMAQDKQADFQKAKILRQQLAKSKAKPSAVHHHNKAGVAATASVPFYVDPVDSTLNPLANIIQSLVGEGVTVSNIETNIPATSTVAGSFNGSAPVLGINSGLLLTSGSVYNSQGPNSSSAMTQYVGTPGYEELGPLGFDAAVISFDIVSNTPYLSFKYVFASEEYNEYVGSGFNDQFGFFISGPGIPEGTNIALLPGTNTGVAINNVNLGLNSEFYLNNETISVADSARFNTIEYDGMTRVLTTTPLNIIPGQTYRLTLAIQDVSDASFDSGVFIEGGSITSNPCVLSLFPEITAPTSVGGGQNGKIQMYVTGSHGVPTYQWTNGATTSSIEDLTWGSYNVVVTDAAGCTATLPNPVVFTSPCTTTVAKPGTIKVTGGAAAVCPAQTRTYTITTVTNATRYEWMVNSENITILAGQGTKSVLVSFTNDFPAIDSIRVKAGTACEWGPHRALAVKKATVATPSVITGQVAGLCGNTNAVYSVVNVAGMTYKWDVPTHVDIISGDGTNSIVASFPGDEVISGTVKVKASNTCNTSAFRTLTVKTVPGTIPALTGPVTVCANSTNNAYSVLDLVGATGYTWTGPTGSKVTAGGVTSAKNILTTSSSAVSVNYAALTATSKLSVKAINGCGAGATKSITLVPAVCRLATDGGEEVSEETSAFQVYPNPASGRFTLTENGSEKLSGELELWNTQGRKVWSMNLDANRSAGSVDVVLPSDVPTGMYLILCNQKLISRIVLR